LKFTEVGREIGKRWKETDDDDKAPYVEKAEKDALRHTREMADYVPAEGTEPAKKKKAKNPVKGATSGFMYFAKMTRAGVMEANPDDSFGEVSKRVGTMWKALDDSKKAPFLAEAAADKKRYVMRLTCVFFVVMLLLLLVSKFVCAVCVLLLCFGVCVCVCVCVCYQLW
jgi:hypothetical protein